MQDISIAKVAVEADLTEFVLEGIHILFEGLVGLYIGIGKTRLTDAVDNQAVAPTDTGCELADGERLGIITTVTIVVEDQDLNQRL